jgi:molybdate transport system regulatory protein
VRLSIRNQFNATVEAVTAGPAMTAVRVRLDGGPTVTAAITSDAAEDLGLAPGLSVTVLIKATEVGVAVDPVGRISIRNLLPGTVQSLEPGAAMTVVKIALTNGGVLTSAITHESAEDLGLTEGVQVTALVKSTDVALATS